MSTLVHLSGEDGLLEAAARVRAADGDGDLVLMAPEGAPALANPLYLATLRDTRPDRPLVLVTAEVRARAMASGWRMPAYASLGAYEQKSVDPTERLEKARARAMVEIGRERGALLRRQRNAVAAAVVALALVAIVAPSAEVVVAMDPVAVGPLDLEVRTAPGGTVPARRLVAQVPAQAEGRATGEDVRRQQATGRVTFRNGSLGSVEIRAGTIVSTSSNIQFRTVEAKTLPPSQLFPFPVVSQVDVGIEAVEAGPRGNVPAGSITRVSDGRLRVTNEQPTRGGDEQHLPVVKQEDYNATATLLDQALDAKSREQVAKWTAAAEPGYRVEEQYAIKTISRTPAAEVVAKEIERFQLLATVEVTAYEVPLEEPRASVIRRLGESARAGYQLDPQSVDSNTTAIELGPEGLTWKLRARGSQRPRLDEGALRLALFGQDREAARLLLADRGLRLLEVRAVPEWWPRLPLLPMRIDIRSGAVAGLPGP